MQTSFIKPLLFPVCTLIAFMLNSTAWADQAPALDASRVCEISLGSERYVTIVAGPNLDVEDENSTELAEVFPETVECPSQIETETGNTKCSKWNYKFISNHHLSHTYIGMSSDLDLFQLIPPSGTIINYSSLGPNLDKRLIRWNSAASTRNASFITSLAEPRIATAGGKKGRRKKFCLILGAGVPLENNGYAQETLTSKKIIESSDGQSKLCTKVDPTTQCEIAVDCGTGEPLPEEDAIDLTELVGVVGVDGVPDPVANFSVPGLACATAVFDNGLPNTRYYCSGGRCWAF